MNTQSEAVPLSEPCFGGREWEFVKNCLDSGWVSSAGSYVTEFEAAVAARCGTKHAVATVNGTAALHIALLLAGVKADEEVLLPTLTFVATANAVRYLGAWPVLIDCEPRHWQMNPELVAGFLRQSCQRRDGNWFNNRTGRRVAAILPVHVLGHPCDVEALGCLSSEYELPLVEDATESLGSDFEGRGTGSFGLVGCFSFNGNKILTTGAGGMLVTDEDSLAERARHLTTQAKSDREEYIHDEVGYNYRLTNVLAAIGCAQMERLDDFLFRKAEIASRYRRGLAGVDEIAWQDASPRVKPNNWLPTLRIHGRRAAERVRELRRDLATNGIQSRHLWQPMHASPAHRDSFAVGGEVALELYETSLSLPSSVTLTETQQTAVIQKIVEGLRKLQQG